MLLYCYYIPMKKAFLLIIASFWLVLGGCTFIRQVPTNVWTGTNTPAITWEQTTWQQNTWTQATWAQTTGNVSTAIPSRNYILQLWGSTPSLSFSLNAWDKIRLLIAQPPVKAIVRVNQIIAPNGEADGPFSSDTDFTATQSGTYRFTIGINQMASQDIYTGSVTVNVTLDLKK